LPIITKYVFVKIGVGKRVRRKIRILKSHEMKEVLFEWTNVRARTTKKKLRLAE
jgi:hypothetical protein